MTIVERLVVFAIFMENGEGIVGKAPDYIMEKWSLVSAGVSDEFVIAGLDMMNQAKFKEWLRVWGKKSIEEVKP
jgi:hypothetical protein